MDLGLMMGFAEVERITGEPNPISMKLLMPYLAVEIIVGASIFTAKLVEWLS